jgi:hypothetical protein
MLVSNISPTKKEFLQKMRSKYQSCLKVRDTVKSTGTSADFSPPPRNRPQSWIFYSGNEGNTSIPKVSYFIPDSTVSRIRRNYSPKLLSSEYLIRPSCKKMECVVKVLLLATPVNIYIYIYKRLWPVLSNTYVWYPVLIFTYKEEWKQSIKTTLGNGLICVMLHLPTLIKSHHQVL